MPAIHGLNTTKNRVSPQADVLLTVEQFYLVPGLPEVLRILLVRNKLT